MQILGEKGLGNTLKITLKICFYLGIVILIALPFVLHVFGLNLITSMLTIYPNGTILLIIANSFIQLFDSLKENNPFCNKNVKILKNTGIVSLIGSCFWFFNLIYSIFLMNNYDAVIILILSFMIILFFGVSIALFILSELLRRATEYKEENELTI